MGSSASKNPKNVPVSSPKVNTNPITLYFNPGSQPSRSVKAILTIMQVKYEGKVIDLMKGEHKQPEYLKINPLGVLPAITDDGFNLGESEAVVRYILNTRAGGDKIYPTDPKIRAQIDKYFPFHHTEVRPSFAPLFIATYSFIFPTRKIEYEPAKEKALKTLKAFNEQYLQGKKYIAGDNLTIADIFAVNEFTQIYLATDFDFSGNPEVKDYIDRCLQDPVLGEVNQATKAMGAGFKAKLAEVKKAQQSE